MSDKLVMDVNEPEDLHELLQGRNIPVERKRIQPGDYVIGEIGVERKTLQDFFSSMVRKRLFDQVERLREAYPLSFLLLEGDVAEVSSYRNPSAFWGAFASITIDRRTPIFFTPDKEQTANLLYVLWRRREKRPSDYGLRHKPRFLTLEERQRFVVQGLPHVGDVLSRKLLERFGSIRNVFAASEEELMDVEKMGPAKAREISELVTTPYKGEQLRLEDVKTADT